MTDILNQSDEDFLNGPVPSFNEEEKQDQTPEPKPEDIIPEEEVVPEPEEENGEDNSSLTGSNEGEEDKPLSEDDIKRYKEFYESVTKGFKADGKEITVTDPNDIVSLMQMGTNYTKKMQQLKPSRAILKMLQDNKITAQDLEYLIDVKSGNKAAIAKLLKDNEVNSYDINEEDANNYQPTPRTPSEAELHLQEVLDSISGSTEYARTVTVLGKQWDNASRALVVEHPEIVADINKHMESGMFDTIWNEVEKQRMFGRLGNMNDLEAYYRVGEAMYANEKQNNTQVPNNQPNTQRNKVAAGTKGSRNTPNPAEVVNVLELSDEEFEKMFKRK